MERKKINRGGILSARYNSKLRFLEIEWDTKRVMRYLGVDEEIARRFLESASPLSIFRDCIEEEYTGQEVSKETGASKTTAKDARKKLNALFGA